MFLSSTQQPGIKVHSGRIWWVYYLNSCGVLVLRREGGTCRRQHVGEMRVLALEPFSLHLTSHPPLNKYFIASPSQALFGHLIFLN